MRRAKATAIKSLVRPSLGPLEEQVLHIICAHERLTVRDVIDRLNDSHAYTTVMTTMDRLFQKGLLQREMRGKSFLYRSALTECQLEAQMAHDLITAFIGYSKHAPELLASALVDAVGACDTALLDRVADEIRVRQALRSQRPFVRSRFQESPPAAYSWPLGMS